MLVGKTERRDVPHEPGEWFEFRQLSGPELDEAEERQTQRALAMVKGLDPGAMAILREQGQAAPAGTEQRYDKDTLVRHAVVAWSYTEPCEDDSKARLDAATRDWAAAVSVEMNTLGEAKASGGSYSPVESPDGSREPIASGRPESV